MQHEGDGLRARALLSPLEGYSYHFKYRISASEVYPPPFLAAPFFHLNTSLPAVT